MDGLEMIAQRRSIRRFKETVIDREMIEKLLSAAVQAPSAHNRQHWHFVVAEGKTKNKIAEMLRSLDEKGSVAVTANVIEQAPVLVLVFERVTDRYSRESIGAAIQNLLLAATYHHLGSLWIGYVTKIADSIGTLLSITEPLVGAVALGESSEEPAARPRLELNQVVTYIEEE